MQEWSSQGTRIPANGSTTWSMARRTEAYVDTSALIAFGDRSDSHYPLFRRLFADPPPLLTTAQVVTEGHGWFLKRYDRTRALPFAAMIEERNSLEAIPTAPQPLHAPTH